MIASTLLTRLNSLLLPSRRWNCVLIGGFWLALSGCSDTSQTNSADTTASSETPTPSPLALLSGTEFEEKLRLLLETASPGTTIDIPAGTFPMSRGLVLNASGVTIRGAGMQQSILSFKDQVAGAEGLLVNASDFTIEDLAIEDAAGDALKINEGSNIVVRRVRTEWTNGLATENGAYGIYPVQTENTLIEGSVAIGASDAGIYVGQSRNIVVCNNRVSFNVAGIEIENSVNADVHNNVAENNTGGILVFNMPDIPLAGHSTRVFNNDVRHNNSTNVGLPGSAVSGVPAGSGIVINSNDKVEIFDNRISDNNTANILISSYFSASFAGQRDLAENFDPYPEQVYIYDNTFSGGGTKPDRPELAQLLAAKVANMQQLPDVVWDGIVRDNASAATAGICLGNPNVRLLNIDAGNDGANIRLGDEGHRCSQPKLAEVVL